MTDERHEALCDYQRELESEDPEVWALFKRDPYVLNQIFRAGFDAGYTSGELYGARHQPHQATT